MSFTIMTDSTANLTEKHIRENGIRIIPFSYSVGGEEHAPTDLDSFDDTSYYDAIRNGMQVTTSQINPQTYIDAMEPVLKAGEDILFVGLSSGISGSFASAQAAREQLLAQYPQRSIALIDSLGAALGEGLLILRAIKCRANGMDLNETHERILSIRDKTYQVFIVDDLMHLKRTGRLSNAHAILGSLLGIKPLLKGNEKGKIVAFEKVRGRKQAIKALAEKYFSLAQNPAKQVVGITHAGCEEDAQFLARLIQEKLPPQELLVLKHEPVTGSHIGPGALALYFQGPADVRYQ